jgi:hypothetical protein
MFLNIREIFSRSFFMHHRRSITVFTMLDTILEPLSSQTVNTYISYFCMTHFNIILSSPRSFNWYLLLTWIFLVSAMRMTYPVSHPPSSNRRNSIMSPVLRYSTVFFYLHSGEWSPNWVDSARRPLTGLLYLARVIVRMENSVE